MQGHFSAGRSLTSSDKRTRTGGRKTPRLPKKNAEELIRALLQAYASLRFLINVTQKNCLFVTECSRGNLDSSLRFTDRTVCVQGPGPAQDLSNSCLQGLTKPSTKNETLAVQTPSRLGGSSAHRKPYSYLSTPLSDQNKHCPKDGSTYGEENEAEDGYCCCVAVYVGIDVVKAHDKVGQGRPFIKPYDRPM